MEKFLFSTNSTFFTDAIDFEEVPPVMEKDYLSFSDLHQLQSGKPFQSAIL